MILFFLNNLKHNSVVEIETLLIKIEYPYWFDNNI